MLLFVVFCWFLLFVVVFLVLFFVVVIVLGLTFFVVLVCILVAAFVVAIVQLLLNTQHIFQAKESIASYISFKARECTATT